MESITLKGWRKVQLVITTDSFGELKFQEQIRRLYHTGGRANFNDVQIGLYTKFSLSIVSKEV